MSFTKKRHNKKKVKIKNVLKNGEKIKSPLIEYSFLKSNRNKVAILVKKYPNNAVNRNKIKRRVKEIYRKNKPQKKSELIIVIKKNVIKKKFEELKEEIKGKIELIK